RDLRVLHDAVAVAKLRADLQPELPLLGVAEVDVRELLQLPGTLLDRAQLGVRRTGNGKNGNKCEETHKWGPSLFFRNCKHRHRRHTALDDDVAERREVDGGGQAVAGGGANDNPGAV